MSTCYTQIIMIHVQGAFNKFPDFLCMSTLMDSTHMKL